MRLPEREDYSYCQDDAVPGFDDIHPIVFMDGECLLCTQAARVIARLDRRGTSASARSKAPLAPAS